MKLNSLTITAITASAILATISGTALAQDLSGLSFCLDPGHGAGTPNQGPTGLREADINLEVALRLKEFMKAAKADSVLLTRLDDTTNPSLSQRESIANQFGVDWFHSVHHNAFDGGDRFTLLLYEEKRDPADRCPNGSIRGTGAAEWPGQTDVTGPLMASRIFQALRTSNSIDRLDWTFYGGCNGGFNLGVLNDLQMPGELSEATFHDHPDEENKMRNPDFLKLEARAIFMTFLDFFDAGEMATGALSGIIKAAANNEPLSGVTVTLSPSNQTYQTDSNGNGLYVFHDLAPGSYTVTAVAPGFDPATRTLQVQGHSFAAADLTLAASGPPFVEATVPAQNATEVDVYESLAFRFSREMNRESVENAFTLGPSAAGHFIWVSDKIVLVEPDTRLDFDTEYTSRIAATATDQSGRFLDGNGDGTGGDSFTIDFMTKTADNSIPVVMDFFPVRRDTGVFERDVFEVTFNKPLDPATVNTSNIVLAPNSTEQIPAVLDFPGAATRVTIIPQKALSRGASYFLTLRPGISLADGSELGRIFSWRFTTRSSNVSITTVDDFEAPELAWGNPSASPFSMGFDPDSTEFELTPGLALSGGGAGTLSYVFTENIGVIQSDFVGGGQPHRLDAASEIGCYVYGHASGNQFRLLVQDSDGVEMLPALTDSRLGWTLYRHRLQGAAIEAGDGGNGQLDGAEFSVSGFRWTRAGKASGALTIDDIFIVESGLPVSVDDDQVAAFHPSGFALYQNYPNPFNPETKISFRLAPQVAGTPVSLQIFDLQGRLVRDLTVANARPGLNQVVWDSRDARDQKAASGVYVYRLRAGNSTQTKKLILLK